jgi:hypothetical protein
MSAVIWSCCCYKYVLSHDRRGSYLLLCGVMSDSLLEALSYALRGNGVQVAGAEDLVDDGGVRRLDFGG